MTGGGRGSRRSWPRPLQLGAALLVVVLLVVTLNLIVFAWPRKSHPPQADAVVVLSGDHGERLSVALRLLREGVTATLVLDGTPDSPEVLRLCAEEQVFEVVCLRPDPDSTQAEARAAARLAADRGWKSLIVVTTAYHVPRSALHFLRCFEGAVDVVGADPPFGWRRSLNAIVHEWLALGHALTLSRGC